MNKKRIMIITPPLVSPSMPSFTGAFAAGCFRRAAINTIVYDAGLDFFANHMFSKNRVEYYFKMAVQKKEQGLISIEAFRLLGKIFQKLFSSSFSLDFFMSASFYDPEKYLIQRNRMDDFLLLFSYGHYPSRIRWNIRSSHLYKDSFSDIFIPFCREKLGIKLKKNRPKVVLLALDSDNQAIAAAAIIDYIKTDFPEIEIVVLQNNPQTCSMTFMNGHTFSLWNLRFFFQWINNTWKCDKRFADIEPDFSLFPLKEYLAPELILPINSSCYTESFPFRKMVTRLKSQYNANGFFIDNQGILSGGVTLIQWENLEKKENLSVKILWDFSRKGVWNHVELSDSSPGTGKDDLLRFISENPNIIHSYDNPILTKSYNDANINGINKELQSYSKVRSLPGQPFWNLLSDPVHLLLYLKHHGKKNLFCLRADSINESLIVLGEDIRFYFKKPADLPLGLLDEICAMVAAGGSVDTKFVRYNLERAYLIGYALEKDILVGNSSLKHPRKQFVQRLNAVTGLDFNGFVERGYTSVRPEYRALGVGAGLLEGLTKRADQYKIFSIISEDNTATQKIAQKNKTKKIAVYFSEKAGKKLGVWMPGNMIEKDWNLTE